MKKDINQATRVARDVRLPIVLKYWTRHLSSYEIRDRVQEECGQNVTARTIQRDIEYLQTKVAADAADDLETKRRAAIATCDRAIAELWKLYDTADVKTKMNSVESLFVKNANSGISEQKPVKSYSASQQKDNVRKTKILAEIREWEKMRNQLMGIDIKHIDIKSDGKSFTGFASVLPVLPNIDQIVAEAERRRSDSDA